MSIENTIPEPKQYFLDLLIKLDFQVADAVYRFRDHRSAINGMAEIIALTGCIENADLKETAQTIQKAQQSQNMEIDEIPKLFATLQKHLMERWFSELKLGLIQASTIQGTREAPKQKTFDPNPTNQI